MCSSITWYVDSDYVNTCWEWLGAEWLGKNSKIRLKRALKQSRHFERSLLFIHTKNEML